MCLDIITKTLDLIALINIFKYVKNFEMQCPRRRKIILYDKEFRLRKSICIRASVKAMVAQQLYTYDFMIRM